MYTSEFKGIKFVEGHPESAKVLGHLEVSVGGQAQLKSLDDVKEALVRKVKAMSGNALINFKYGQKSSFWGSLLSLDSVNWYGSGDAANL